MGHRRRFEAFSRATAPLVLLARGQITEERHLSFTAVGGVGGKMRRNVARMETRGGGHMPILVPTRFYPPVLPQ